MTGSNMPKTEYDLKAILFPADGTPHRLHSISRHKTQMIYLLFVNKNVHCSC